MLLEFIQMIMLTMCCVSVLVDYNIVELPLQMFEISAGITGKTYIIGTNYRLWYRGRDIEAIAWYEGINIYICY